MASDGILDDLDESLDVQETEDEVTQVRDHIVIKIHNVILSSALPSRLAIRTTKSAITYTVGGIDRTNNPAGTGKFVCTNDGAAPKELPGDYVVRRQTWEYFGPWGPAPADWNQ